MSKKETQKQHSPEGRNIFKLNENEKTTFSYMLETVSSRKQVENLNAWMKKMCSEIENEKLENKPRAEKLLTINKFVCLELLRQVSIQCGDRGALLRKVIDNSVDLTVLYFIACR